MSVGRTVPMGVLRRSSRVGLICILVNVNTARSPISRVIMTDSVRKGRKTKKPEYDLPLKKGDCLILPPLVSPNAVIETTVGEHTVLDLFCGAGGMSLGFLDAGFGIALGIDHDAWACQTYTANIPTKVQEYDLSSFESKEDLQAFLEANGAANVTGVVGGPPCQGFSRVGRGRIRHRNRLNGHDEHLKDQRNDLYRAFVECISVVRPLFFVMENVPDLDRFLDDDGKTCLADRIEQEFKELKYKVERRILNAEDFGVPQSRLRLFFLGVREDSGLELIWPDPEVCRITYGRQTLRNAIGDLPAVTDGHMNRKIAYAGGADTWLRRWYRKGMEGNEGAIFDHITRLHRQDDKEAFKLLQEGQKYTDLPAEYRRYQSESFKDKYRKLIWNEPSWTITAHIKRDGYRYIYPDNEHPRTISLREAARIQSFPDRWRFCGYRSNAFDQIGNAVPPLLSRAFGRVIKAQLDGRELGDDPLVTG